MIIIAPFAQKLRNGNVNPKNYPFWKELINQIDEPIIQVGVEGEEQLVPDFRRGLSILELRSLLQECRTWVSCDSFFQHLGWDEGVKGVVLWSVSDPNIFGHPENINLLGSRSYLVPNQFLWWENVTHDPQKFVKPEVVLDALKQLNLR